MNKELLIKEKKSNYEIKEERKNLVTLIIFDIVLVVFDLALLTIWLEDYNIGKLIGIVIITIIIGIINYVYFTVKNDEKKQESKYILINEQGIKFNFKMLTKNGTKERKSGDNYIEWNNIEALIDVSDNKLYTVENNEVVKKELDFKAMTNYKIIPNIYNPDEGSYDEINNSIILVTKDEKFLRLEELFIEQCNEEEYTKNIETTINLWQNSFKNQ